MSIRIKAKYIAFLISFIAIYLLVVAVWALINTEQLLLDFKVNGEPILSEQQISALLLVEDPEFNEHIGVNISKGQGLTTISSSLARNIYLDGKSLSGINGVFQRFYRLFFRCCKRVDLGRDIMAIVLNAKITKEEQISLYLQTTYMGHYKGKKIVGYFKAAQTYYEKPLSELTNEEFIGLLAMPLSPNKYNPKKNTESHNERLNRIFKLIAGACEAQGWLDLLYENCAEKTSQG